MKTMTIERIDNNGDYSPENCRWATHKEQGSNKRNNIRLTLDGETKPLSKWAKEIGLTANTLHMRIWRGWTTEEALTRPKRPFTSPIAELGDGIP